MERTSAPFTSGKFRALICIFAALICILAGCAPASPGTGSVAARSTDDSASEWGPIGTFDVTGVAPWRGDTKGAYSLIHDDLCGTWAFGIMGTVDVELKARGLRAGFATIAGECEANASWSQPASLLAQGHEIVSHSYTHPPFAEAVLTKEIDEAKALFDLRLGPGRVRFYAFPEDTWNEAALTRVRASGHIGSRTGLGLSRVNAPGFDPYATEFQSMPPTLADLLAGLEDAIAARAWVVRELHGVADDSFEPVSLGDYRVYLDTLKARVESRDLWVAPPSEVIEYQAAVTACGLPMYGAEDITFTTGTGCDLASPALTVVVVLASPVTELRAMQGTAMLPVRGTSTRFSIEIPPAKGAVVLTVR